MKKYDLTIINGLFWPNNKIQGEALLQLAEKACHEGNKTLVVTQLSKNFHNVIMESGRGLGVDFKIRNPKTNSSSKILFRALDFLAFGCWVFWILIITRSKKVYVGTDPPLIVPFIVFLFSKIKKYSYFYHFQDIYPEVGQKIIKSSIVFIKLSLKIDALVINNASSIITITDEMKKTIIGRSNTSVEINTLTNPGTTYKLTNINKQINGFVYSGNIGRFQKIPLLIASINRYKKLGGKLPFMFIGYGFYSDKIKLLSNEYEDVNYSKFLDEKANRELSSQYSWGLVPIEDETLKYAFPSKTSSYLNSNVKILSICSPNTNLAKWVVGNNFGINVRSNMDDIVDTFFKIENGFDINRIKDISQEDFSIETYVQKIYSIIFKSKSA